MAWTRSHAKLGQRFCKFSNRARYQTIGDTILHLVPCALSSSRGPTGTRQTSSDGRLLKDGFRRAISDGCLPTDSLRLRRTDGSLRTGCSAVCLRAGRAPSRMSLPKRTLVKPPTTQTALARAYAWPLRLAVLERPSPCCSVAAWRLTPTGSTSAESQTNTRCALLRKHRGHWLAMSSELVACTVWLYTHPRVQ